MNQISIIFTMLSGMSVASTAGTIAEKKKIWLTQVTAMVNLSTMLVEPATRVAGRNISAKPVANAPEVAQRRLHLQLARLQGALERLPDEGLAEQLLRLDDQVAAVGPVQGARAQLAITGVERALIGAVLDTTEQVVVGRMRLEHHRRAAIDRVADHQARAVLLLEQHAVLCLRAVLVDQLLDHGLQQVDLHRLQISLDAGVLGILFRKGRQQRLQCLTDGLVIELAQLVGGLALPLREAGQLFVQPHFQRGNIFVVTLALGFRQLSEFGLVQRLAVLHRGEGDIGAVAVEGDFLLERKLLDDVQRLVVALVEGAVDGALLLLEGGRLEHCREGGQQVVDQLIDIGDERTRGTRRQLQRTRLARLVEVDEELELVRQVSRSARADMLDVSALRQLVQARDVQALQVQGRFLESKFGGTDLAL